MKRKHVIITLFLCALVFSLAVVLNTWTPELWHRVFYKHSTPLECGNLSIPNL